MRYLQKWKAVMNRSIFASLLSISTAILFTEAFPADVTGEEREICNLALQLMDVLGKHGIESPNCGISGRDKGAFTVFKDYIEEDAGRRRRKWAPAFKRGYVCEKAGFNYVHQEDALPNQLGARIGIERNGKDYEFDFEWGRIVPNDEVYLCGHITGKAIKSGNKWQLNCNIIDCSKPPQDRTVPVTK